MKGFTLCIVGWCGISGFQPLLAQSNLANAQYPVHQCGAKPAPPIRPEAFEDNEAVSAYNQQVDTYNGALQAYVGCIQAYIDNASEDIELIRNHIKNAVDETNRE